LWLVKYGIDSKNDLIYLNKEFSEELNGKVASWCWGSDNILMKIKLK